MPCSVVFCVFCCVHHEHHHHEHHARLKVLCMRIVKRKAPSCIRQAQCSLISLYSYQGQRVAWLRPAREWHGLFLRHIYNSSDTEGWGTGTDDRWFFRGMRSRTAAAVSAAALAPAPSPAGRAGAATAIESIIIVPVLHPALRGPSGRQYIPFAAPQDPIIAHGSGVASATRH